MAELLQHRLSPKALSHGLLCCNSELADAGAWEAWSGLYLHQLQTVSVTSSFSEPGSGNGRRLLASFY